MSTRPMTFDEFKRLIAIDVRHNAFTGKVECDVTFYGGGSVRFIVLGKDERGRR